tara:strand:- start:646 stop:753 length:108 start_codon:yes stop_codon:yes gene_type:complete
MACVLLLPSWRASRAFVLALCFCSPSADLPLHSVD